jgi:hypothetical protein
LGIFESEKKILACTNFNYTFIAWRIDNFNPGICTCPIYLCNLLKFVMAKKFKPKKKRIRVPVPQKPPKVEDDKKKYDREKEKEKIRKQIPNS